MAIGLYTACAVAYRLHFGTFLKSEGRPAFSGRVTLSQIAVAVVVVIFGIAGVASPIYATNSSFALWLQQPYSLALYLAWCFIGATAAGSLSGVVRFLGTRR